mmetsp:Transcript_6454/g.19082  ORF Transcript_6454/g.19082 Transcript_6454/m.19082 type:complete len:209 (+) Transcript_6454:250-876(+)
MPRAPQMRNPGGKDERVRRHLYAREPLSFALSMARCSSSLLTQPSLLVSNEATVASVTRPLAMAICTSSALNVPSPSESIAFHNFWITCHEISTDGGGKGAPSSRWMQGPSVWLTTLQTKSTCLAKAATLFGTASADARKVSIGTERPVRSARSLARSTTLPMSATTCKIITRMPGNSLRSFRMYDLYHSASRRLPSMMMFIRCLSAL